MVMFNGAVLVIQLLCKHRNSHTIKNTEDHLSIQNIIFRSFSNNPKVSNLPLDELEDDVTRVHVDGADGHDLLAVALAEVAQQHGDERVELCDLLLVVVLHRVLVALLQARERNVHLGAPPDLGAAQSHLKYETRRNVGVNYRHVELSML